jgi:hypothetical protein
VRFLKSAFVLVPKTRGGSSSSHEASNDSLDMTVDSDDEAPIDLTQDCDQPRPYGPSPGGSAPLSTLGADPLVSKQPAMAVTVSDMPAAPSLAEAVPLSTSAADPLVSKQLAMAGTVSDMPAAPSLAEAVPLSTSAADPLVSMQPAMAGTVSDMLAAPSLAEAVHPGTVVAPLVAKTAAGRTRGTGGALKDREPLLPPRSTPAYLQALAFNSELHDTTNVTPTRGAAAVAHTTPSDAAAAASTGHEGLVTRQRKVIAAQRLAAATKTVQRGSKAAEKRKLQAERAEQRQRLAAAKVALEEAKMKLSEVQLSWRKYGHGPDVGCAILAVRAARAEVEKSKAKRAKRNPSDSLPGALEGDLQETEVVDMEVEEDDGEGEGECQSEEDQAVLLDGEGEHQDERQEFEVELQEEAPGNQQNNKPTTIHFHSG